MFIAFKLSVNCVLTEVRSTRSTGQHCWTVLATRKRQQARTSQRLGLTEAGWTDGPLISLLGLCDFCLELSLCVASLDHHQDMPSYHTWLQSLCTPTCNAALARRFWRCSFDKHLSTRILGLAAHHPLQLFSSFIVIGCWTRSQRTSDGSKERMSSQHPGSKRWQLLRPLCLGSRPNHLGGVWRSDGKGLGKG